MSAPGPRDLTGWTHSVTFEAPFNLTAWQIMAGAKACRGCGTPVAWMSLVDDKEKPTGEQRLEEVSEPPAFAREHSPERCHDARRTV